MLLSDTKIRGLMASGVLNGAKEANVGPVSYDLQTKGFYVDGKQKAEVELSPGDSVFVGSKETISLPRDIAARVLLKNSRIRQGLSLDAPLYFPGHSTRIFFRVTNVSADTVSLDSSRGIAQLTFETVDGVEHPYEGAFSDEMDFSGLASYEDVYGDQVRKLDEKRDEIKGLETRIYGNVMTLFGVFAAIFTFVNVNAGALSSDASPSWVVIVDLMVLGGFAFLAGIMDSVVSRRGNGKPRRWLFILAILAIAASIYIAV